MRRITIRVLGPFEATIDDAPVTGFSYAKVRALLAYLAVEARRSHTRAELATLLWPDQPEQAARASLSQALTTLRNAVGDRGASQPLMLSDASTVQLNPQVAVDVDVTLFLAALRATEAHAHHSWRTCAACSEQLRRALELYRGAFLADLSIADSAVFDEWSAQQREHHLQRAMSALERMVERAEWRGDYPAALGYAQRLVALEPWLEGNQRACIRLLALNGETTAALAQYRQLQTLLREELAAEPEEATAELIERIRRGDSAALQLPGPPFRVPLPPSALVGRNDELQAVCARLRELKGRALTIIGTGGIGKTRLALEVGHALRHDYEDGVYFVELAALGDTALVADAVAQALGVQERPGRHISEVVRDYLRSRHVLLILDNFEHVVSAASMVAELLAACPALTMLVTSRAPLAIRAEQQFILEPLGEADAVRLFVRRAHAVGASLAPEGADTTVYEAICRRVDRLPLAIELIAVRARTLAPLELLRQLEQPLEALARGPRDLSPRHRSLRHAIQWSYELLTADEQRAFRCLGVFSGGCSVEAAQAVLGDEVDVLPLLEGLHQASLVQQQPAAGETRFVMLQTIREFALEQLTARGEAQTAAGRHMDYFTGIGQAAYVELLRPDGPRWRSRIAAEQDNLRAAFRRAMEQRAVVPALQIATGLWRFHWMAGLLREGLERLEAALAYREQAPLEVQIHALRAAGNLAVGLSDYARARRWLEVAVELGWRLSDPQALQPALTGLGYALFEQGELEDARINLEVSLELARREVDSKVAKFPLGLLAGVHLRLGEYAQARVYSEEGLRINRACGDTEGTADALRTLASIVNAQGDTQHAQSLCEQALALHSSLDHQLGMGQDYAMFGDIARARGDAAAALAHYQRCLNFWRDRENTANSAVVVGKIAGSLAALGEAERAATLIGAAAAMHERAGVRLAALERAAYDETTELCRAALGDAELDAVRAAGRVLTPTQAISLALQPHS